MHLISMSKQVHFPADKQCDDTDLLWQASWSKITQHTLPLAREASPKSFSHSSSIPWVLIKIYWIIFAKLNGPSYSNYQLLNVSAEDVTWRLAALSRGFSLLPIPSLFLFKKLRELMSQLIRGKEQSPFVFHWPSSHWGSWIFFCNTCIWFGYCKGLSWRSIRAIPKYKGHS